METHNKELSIVVISYNTRQMTLECLQSVYDQAQSQDFDLLVYDNASQDGSADAISEAFPQVTLIRSDKNWGFACANNKSIELVNSEYVLLLNPDTIVLDHAIDRLLAFAKEHPDAGIWGGKTLFGDKSLNPGSCFRKMTIWNQICRATGLAGVFKHSPLFHSEHYGGWLRDSVRYVDIVCGCFLLIKTQVWRDLGGFDSRFFMYGEEADLCLRAQKRGFSPIVTPNAVIVHYGGGSETVRADKMVRLFSGKRELQRVHWAPAAQFVGKVCFLTWVCTRIVAFKLKSWIQFKSPALADRSYRQWKEIYSRRNEWINGYSQRN